MEFETFAQLELRSNFKFQMQLGLKINCEKLINTTLNDAIFSNSSIHLNLNDLHLSVLVTFMFPKMNCPLGFVKTFLLYLSNCVDIIAYYKS